MRGCWVWSDSELDRFKHGCSTHPGSNAHGDHAVFLIVAVHAVDHGCGKFRACRASEPDSAFFPLFYVGTGVDLRVARSLSRSANQ